MKKPHKMIRVFWGKSPNGEEGYCIEVIGGDKYEKLIKGITLNSDDKARLAGMISLQVYDYFIQEFLNENIKKIKKIAVEEKLKQDYPFIKLIGKLWWRKKI